ncbi:hypothetical protein [Ramlibacter sp.]|uniref:hypothetical protein n=1 Tax=Ramlibacter sp. TaxID=1917967 RepID=UPI003D0DCB72
MTTARLSTLLAAAALLAGCSSMLPRGTTDMPSPFRSFAEAQAAAERIAPFRTRVDDLQSLGFDPKEGRNVTQIPYPDIVARLAPYPGVSLDALDPGIRACIVARSGCRAYVFRFERIDRKREGGFWADFLNVRRVTNTTGWWFETLVVVSDDVVLFRNHSGEPRIEKVERQTNPLGPFQPAGEGAGAALLR